MPLKQVSPEDTLYHEAKRLVSRLSQLLTEYEAQKAADAVEVDREQVRVLHPGTGRPFTDRGSR